MSSAQASGSNTLPVQVTPLTTPTVLTKADLKNKYLEPLLMNDNIIRIKSFILNAINIKAQKGDTIYIKKFDNLPYLKKIVLVLKVNLPDSVITGDLVNNIPTLTVDWS